MSGYKLNSCSVCGFVYPDEGICPACNGVVFSTSNTNVLLSDEEIHQMDLELIEDERIYRNKVRPVNSLWDAY